ncbi:hypothetical protein EDB19DRAFT_1833253 [Suillus lakei]|nr:hypothetical protein EDB19DRAFT_1833253 [Suillus lakei]
MSLHEFACSKCLIVTQAPFPDNIAVEMTLAKAAWHKACQIKGLNVKLTPAGVKMISDAAFEDAIQEYRLEEQDDVEAIHSSSAAAVWFSPVQRRLDENHELNLGPVLPEMMNLELNLHEQFRVVRFGFLGVQT